MAEMPLHLQFANMAKSHAFNVLMKTLDDKIIQEQKKFFQMEKSDESEIQRLKVKFFQEFMDDIRIIVINTQTNINERKKESNENI